MRFRHISGHTVAPKGRKGRRDYWRRLKLQTAEQSVVVGAAANSPYSLDVY